MTSRCLSSIDVVAVCTRRSRTGGSEEHIEITAETCITAISLTSRSMALGHSGLVCVANERRRGFRDFVVEHCSFLGSEIVSEGNC